MTTSRLFWCSIGLVFSLFVGCSRGSASIVRVPIEGKVLLGSAPAQSGAVCFVPIEGTKGPVVTASVVNGAYRFDRENGPVAGKYKVEFLANAKSKRIDLDRRQKMPTKGDVSVPAKSSSKNILEVDVTNNRTTFDVKIPSEFK